ncbi:MAG: hypothetical protein GKR91_02730 [Pseudomonadales bacterium]|nr:hypothetical protein [Pseudomonadales bacterium]
MRPNIDAPNTAKKSVLVTEGAQKNTLGIVRSLAQEGNKVHVVVSSKWDTCKFSKFTSGFLYLDRLSVKCILGYIQKNSIDSIIPVGIISTQFFSDHRDSFSKVELVIPTRKQLKIACSKQLTYDKAIDCEIPIPETYYPQDIEEIEVLAGEIPYPCVIKWLYEVGANIVDYAFNKQDLLKKYRKLCELHEYDETTGLPMIQEYIEGDGVGEFALYYKGEKISSYQHKRLREAPPSGGSSTAAITISNENLSILAHKILKRLDWNGVAMVEFKEKPNGDLVLMEINAKFWGSYDLGHAAGLNFPANLIRLGAGEYVKPAGKYIIGKKYYWPLDGDLRHATVSLRRFCDVLGCIVDPRVKSNLWLVTDPKPAVMKLIVTLAVSIRNAFRSLR